MSNPSPSITPSWTLTLWLAVHEKRQDAGGELARAVRQYPAWPGWRDIEGLAAYCRTQKLSSALIPALRQAWDE
jgi:hypothetical protein